MKRLGILLVLLGAVALFVGRGTAPLFVGHTAAAAVGLSSVSGSYAFSLSFHDPLTGQEGASVGSMVFNGAGGVRGVYSQNARCNPDCGQQLVSEAHFTGTYEVRRNGSAKIDICITLTASTVRTVYEGAFSGSFRHLRLVQTQIASPCEGTLGPQPNVSSGTADKV